MKEMETQDLKELYSSLAKAQEQMESAKLDSKNPFFKSKYADLPSVIKASRPYLSKNGIAVIQRIMKTEQGNLYLSTRLCHTSGQWIESEMPISPSKNTIQEIGSYITYVKRYAYSAMVGVVGDDEDDDGEKAMNRTKTNQNNSHNDNQNDRSLSKAQIEILSKILGKLDISKREAFFTRFKISKISDLLADDFETAYKKLKATLEAVNEDN